MEEDRVLIAGGGIAGLALALELDARGIACAVFESAAEVRPLGVGINLQPHAVRVLAGLGLDDRLTARSVAPGRLLYCNRHGQQVWAEPRGRDAGYAFPQLSIHRGVLQLELLAAVRDRLGPDAVRTGRAVAGFVDDGDGITVSLTAGRSGPLVESVRGGVLVGADGVQSTVRARLHPREGPPRFAGRLLWRGVTRARPFLDGRTVVMAGHPHHTFVCYPIEPVGDDGRQAVSWCAELPLAAAAPPAQDWSRRVDTSAFRAAFAGWRFDWLDIPALIDGAGETFEYPLVDRDPLDHWGSGRVSLIGDAAHPMYPTGSNGASQAILDAEALANALARERDPATALAAYEEARLLPTAAIVLANREHGPERVLQLAEERAPSGFADVHDVIPRHELEAIASDYAKVSAFSAEQVDAIAGGTGAPPPQLRPAFELRLLLDPPLLVDGGAEGARPVAPITGGTVAGAVLVGSIEAGTGSWSRHPVGGAWAIAARAVVRADDGTLVEAVIDGVDGGRRDATGAPYVRATVRFVTVAPSLAYLADRLYVADVRELDGAVVLRAFEVL